LVADIPFNGNANDISGNENHVTIHGEATLTNDRFGKQNNAYQFDGIDDYLEITDSTSLDIAGELSLSVWLYYEPQSQPDGHYTILEKSNPADGQARYGLGLIGNRVELCIESVAGQRCLDSTTQLSSARWHHMVGQYDGETLSLFINGTIIAGQRIYTPSNIMTNDSPLFIGSDPYQPQPLFIHGSIDDIRIYDKVISKAEIDALYRQVKLYLPVILK
jgi:hypothetical protein